MKKFIWIIAAKVLLFFVLVGLMVYFMMPESRAEPKYSESDTSVLKPNSIKDQLIAQHEFTTVSAVLSMQSMIAKDL